MIALLPQGSLVKLPFPSRQRVDSCDPSYHFADGVHEALIWNKGTGICARPYTGSSQHPPGCDFCAQNSTHMEHPYTQSTFNLPPYSYCSSFLRLCFLSYKDFFMFKHGKEYILCKRALPCREGPSSCFYPGRLKMVALWNCVGQH